VQQDGVGDDSTIANPNAFLAQADPQSVEINLPREHESLHELLG